MAPYFPGATSRSSESKSSAFVNIASSSSGVRGDLYSMNVNSIEQGDSGSKPIIEDNTVRQPASSVVDAKVGYRHKNWEFSLGTLNLLNSHSADIAYYYHYRLKGQPPRRERHRQGNARG